MSVFHELKRRNVFRVAAAYVVVGWLAVEVLTTLLPTFGAPDWVARVFVAFVAIGFIPAVVFSWVYELTPAGLKRESQVAPGTSITRDTGRKLDLITIAAVILGVGFLGLSRFIAPGTPQGPAAPAEEAAPVAAAEASVAVLPFSNMSANAENEYFSDGLTETLLHMLAQVPDLKVAARTSSFAFKNDHRDIREIADALNVAHVLEGSVQRAGDRVRITAQLIRADDGFHVWSESYDRTLSDIFRIQDEIAGEVSGALTSSLLGDAGEAAIVSVDTESIAAYDAYLKALGFVATQSYRSLALAEQELKQALALDTDFHEARKLLAQTYHLQTGTGMIGSDDAWRRASALLDEVIAEHPDDVQAQALALMIDIDHEVQTGNTVAGLEAIPLLESILAKAPNVHTARIQLAQTLAIFKRMDEAEQHFRILLDNDDLNPRLHWLHGNALMQNDRLDEAERAFARSAELAPGNPNAWASLAYVQRRNGDAVGYVDNFLRAIELDPQDSELVSIVADYLFDLGLVEQGDVYLRRATAISPAHPMTRMNHVRRYYALEDFEQALATARAMIADDVENRHGSYPDAVMYFAELSVARGDAESAYLFLENNAPAVNRPEQFDAGLKYLFAQEALFSLWYAALPDEQATEKTRTWERLVRQLGFDEQDMPLEFVDIRMLRGETEQAIELALAEVLTEPAASFPDWEAWVERDFMAPLAADTRVRAELDRLAAETGQVREDLVQYLAARGAN